MDSGNTSGSLQSSSGGDEEFDSRSDHRILSNNNPSSAATTTTTTTTTAHFSNQNLLSLHNLPSTSTVLFDPSTSYLQSLSSHSNNSNPLLNMDFLRPSSRQRPPSDLGNFTGASSMFGTNQHQQLPFMPNNNPSPLMQPHNPQQHGGAKFITTTADPPLGNNNQSSSTSLGVRNSKKRTRASRRAPTTVLTTDTSNFRAMVQEFTGIPAPPFSGGSSYSRRLDLFGSSTLRSGHLDPMYPLRPSPQKLHPSAANPFLPSDSSTPSLLLDMHNPLLSFQSLLQPHQHQHQLSSSSSLQLQDQMGMSTQGQHQQHQQLNVSSGQGWRSGVEQLHHHLRASNSNSNDHHQPPGAYHHQRSSNNDATIFTYAQPPPPSDFDHHHQNTNPPAPPRGDGTVDSWICPSD